LTDARGKKSLARFVEVDAGALFDQHTELTQLVFGQTGRRSLAFAHRGHVSAPVKIAVRRSEPGRRSVLNGQRLPGRAARIPLPWRHAWPRGTAPGPRSTDRTVSRAGSRWRRFREYLATFAA